MSAMPYAMDKLMAETRRLAAAYHLATDQVMPVTGELARYDAIHLLDLSAPVSKVAGIDATGLWEGTPATFLIKGRVIFQAHKSGQRIGAVHMAAPWQILLVVLYHADYTPSAIWAIPKDRIQADRQSPTKTDFSIQKCQKIGQLVWSASPS